MRKLWILAVAALLVVAVSAPSFAAETTLTGSYRIRGVSEWNYAKDTAGSDLYTGYFDQRFRLTITHKRSEFLKAVVSVDIVEDMWGQQRNFRTNNNSISGPGFTSADGYVNTAYIEAITKVGLFKLGVDNIGGRFGHGTWSDSGMSNGSGGNPGVTWGMKIDNFIVTVSYIKYVDFVDTIVDNAVGVPAGSMKIWPGGPTNETNIGGTGSDFSNVDVDTYVITAHYVSDTIKVGALYQLIRDPAGIGASYLVGGLRDFGKFAGEPLGYAAFGVPMNWPLPSGYATGFQGFGRAGLYEAWLHIAAIYADIKLMDGKLNIKAEYDRIWGRGDILHRGELFNTALGVAGVPALYRLPDELLVDGHTVYADVSYDFDVLKVGMAFLYGAGEKHWRPYTQSHYHFNTTGNDDFTWGNVILPGNDALLGSVDAPLGLGDTPENLTSIKLYWSLDPIEKLNVHGAVIWAQYTEKVGRYAHGSLSPSGQPFYGHPMNYTDPGSAAAMLYVPAHNSHDLGWEVDLGLTYEIMEGLSLNSEFGVLFTGDAFDYITIANGEEHSWGPIYRWINTLTYEF